MPRHVTSLVKLKLGEEKMAANNKLDRIRSQLEKLRKDSLEMVVAANKIVYQGVQRVTDHELKSLNDTYQSALRSLKKARSGGNFKDVAGRQIDVLQDTVNRVIASAREAMEIVAETREELTKMMHSNIKGGKVLKSDLDRVTSTARKAITEARDSALKAAGKAPAKTSKTAKRTVRKTAKKTAGAAKKTARKATKKSAPKKSTSRSKAARGSGPSVLSPSPNSRASRATSRAKKTVSHTVKPSTASAAGSEPESVG